MLLFATSAGAATVSLKGTVPGDANARVTMKVVKVRGTPVRAKRIEGISPPSGLPAPNNLNNLFVTGKLRRGAAVVRR